MGTFGEQRWSTWPETSHAGRGPLPWPEWVVTDGDAIDYELGVVKTGKEAEIHLIRRYSPSSGREALMAAKRYKPTVPPAVRARVVNGSDRMTQSGRDKRAIAKMSKYGQFLVRSEWATSEFEFLRTFYAAGVPVPYPVQIQGAELLMEWVGDEHGVAAERLIHAQLDAGRASAAFEQVLHAMLAVARLGYAHGDLSPYNILVSGGV